MDEHFMVYMAEKGSGNCNHFTILAEVSPGLPSKLDDQALEASTERGTEITLSRKSSTERYYMYRKISQIELRNKLPTASYTRTLFGTGLINDDTNLDEPFRWISRKRGSATPSRPWLCVMHEPGQRSDWHGQIHKLTAKKKTTERSFTD